MENLGFNLGFAPTERPQIPVSQPNDDYTRSDVASAARLLDQLTEGKPVSKSFKSDFINWCVNDLNGLPTRREFMAWKGNRNLMLKRKQRRKKMMTLAKQAGVVLGVGVMVHLGLSYFGKGSIDSSLVVNPTMQHPPSTGSVIGQDWQFKSDGSLAPGNTWFYPNKKVVLRAPYDGTITQSKDCWQFNSDRLSDGYLRFCHLATAKTGNVKAGDVIGESSEAVAMAYLAPGKITGFVVKLPSTQLLKAITSQKGESEGKGGN